MKPAVNNTIYRLKYLANKVTFKCRLLPYATTAMTGMMILMLRKRRVSDNYLHFPNKLSFNIKTANYIVFSGSNKNAH